ncbi:hypothetical protein SNEBB_007223 [Seison nebaliae]|nr:hypothetical protein SNEBB_007223 [Seison nebaliae]
MNLDPNFAILQFDQKLAKLNKLYEESDKTVVGLYNHVDIGVCMTNAIVGMITSSVFLMKVIEEKQKCKKFDLCNFMEKIYRCLEKPVPNKIDNLNETVGDVLRTGILEVAQNITHSSDYGFCGDYLIFKTYLTGNQLNTIPKEGAEEKLTRLAKSSKHSDCSDMLRWDTLLNEMFNVHNLVERGQSYEFIYYPEINMLNLHLFYRTGIKRTNYNQIRINKPEPFLKNEEQLKIGDLSERLSSLTDIPDVLQIGLSEPPIFEFHSTTVDSMIRAFTDGFYFMRFMGKYDVANFRITLAKQFHTIPQLKNNELFTIYLPTNKQNTSYNLKAIAIAIDDEIEVMYKELKPMSGKAPRSNPQCIEGFRQQIMESIRIKEPQVYKYLSKEEHHIVDRLKVICEWIVTYATDFFYEKSSLIHVISLIQRNNKWLLMNDEFSIKINNVELFTEILRLERVTGLLFERK